MFIILVDTRFATCPVLVTDFIHGYSCMLYLFYR